MRLIIQLPAIYNMLEATIFWFFFFCITSKFTFFVIFVFVAGEFEVDREKCMSKEEIMFARERKECEAMRSVVKKQAIVVPFKIEEDLEAAISTFKKDEVSFVGIKVNMKDESLLLKNTQVEIVIDDVPKEFEAGFPGMGLLKLGEKTLLVTMVPETCKVRTRVLLSTAKNRLTQHCRKNQIVFKRVIEINDISEIVEALNDTDEETEEIANVKAKTSKPIGFNPAMMSELSMKLGKKQE
eukprot:TRINITY_DN3142_c0_g1_i1.p1 TRINITY_DN3142_c0_g1~~TRINITY_DN3142_c0_g1_i1.p1  ORF type:complete len:240 (-),score=71.30 TRINITY_DN3142_c0_g1_i1:182-901(-)